MDKQSELILRDGYCRFGPTYCAEMLGITYKACVLRALRMGIGSRRSARKEEIIKYIREWYPQKTTKECANKLGISLQHVRGVASEIGVVGIRAKTQYSKSVNAEFFDSWTSESAYVLGFLYADGSIRKDKISFYQNDSQFLETIRHVMGINNDVKPHMERCHVLSFNCCYLADRLKEIGVRERKSFGNMVFPTGLPDVLYGHFFRGFFDGDGSVGIYGKWNNLRVSLWGQRSFIERLYVDTHRLVGTNGGGVRKATSKREDFFTCSWGSKEDTVLIYKWMYEDCKGIRIQRKMDIFDNWLRSGNRV